MPMVPLLAALALAGQSTPPTPVPRAPAATPSVNEAGRRAVIIAAAAEMAGEIVVSDEGGVTFDVVLGLADREHGRAHRVGQRWIWGSVTKQVAATLAMQEVERGRLSLDAPVGRYLRAFAGNRAITVRQLLQHRSGLPDPDATSTADGVPSFYRATGAAVGDEAAARGYCAGPAVGQPGGDFHYNNCDYLVLGAILNAVTGQSFGELVRARIARPLKLRSVRLAANGTPAGGAAATGYLGEARYPAINVAAFGTAGALTGTARDLAVLDQALLAGRLLTPASRAVLWAGDPSLGYQALGVWSYSAPLKGCAAPVRLVERRGDVGGTQVRNVIAPYLGLATAVFTNDASLDFGEVWQGKGLTHDLLAAAFCPA